MRFCPINQLYVIEFSSFSTQKWPFISISFNFSNKFVATYVLFLGYKLVWKSWSVRYIFSGQFSRFFGCQIYEIPAEKYFWFKMLLTFERKIAQRSVASQNDHKSRARFVGFGKHLLLLPNGKETLWACPEPRTVCQLRVSPNHFYIFFTRLPKHFYWYQHS